MQRCENCGTEFPFTVIADGVALNIRGRKRCLLCRAYRPQREPRKAVRRPVATKQCERCGAAFALRQVIDGKLRFLYRRRFCLTCSPFGIHNTSKSPPGIASPDELKEHRRRRRNAKTYRYQKKRRKLFKAELIAARGGRCESCGYHVTPAALEFHHRDPATKDFGIGRFSGSHARLLAEAAKCELLCANCHRQRHLATNRVRQHERRAQLREERKAKAVAMMGSACAACDLRGPQTIFEFHHWNAAEKDFGISEDGILRSWAKVLAELAKCVMLCANCHREVHAAVRTLDKSLLGLAEDALPYVA